MANFESTQSCRIPMKSLQNCVLNHQLVTILFNVEWPQNGGDDPILVININSKAPSVPCFQQNQPAIMANSVQHYQENLGSTHQQQQCYHPPQINHCEPSNSTLSNRNNDQNDNSAIVLNRIKMFLKSPFPTTSENQPQSFLFTQNFIHAPSNEPTDSRLGMSMSNINPTSSSSSIQSMPPVMNPYFDSIESAMMAYPSTIPTSPTGLSNSQQRLIICTCKNPTMRHSSSCPAHPPAKQVPNINFLPDPMHHTNVQRVSLVPPTHINHGMSLSAGNEPVTVTTLVPLSNPNSMISMDPSSSSVTTIISQPSSYSSNTAIYPTIKIPSMNPTGSFQQMPLNFSQVVINNQSNYMTNPSIPMPMIAEQTTIPPNTRRRKPRTIKRVKQADKTPIKTQPSSNSSSLLSSPTANQKEVLTNPDHSEAADNPLSGSMNELELTTVRQPSPSINANVRSPVELDDHVLEVTTQTVDPSQAVDEVITDVLDGKVSIRMNSTSPPSQLKRSLASQLVWENNVSVIAKTPISPLHREPPTSNEQNIVQITEQEGVFPSLDERNQTNTSPTTTDSNKRVRSKSKSSENPKHTTQPKTNASPTTTTSNIGNRLSSWSDTPISSSSADSASSANHSFLDGSLTLPEVNTIKYPISTTNRVQVIHTDDQDHNIQIDDLFTPDISKDFDFTTPPSVPYYSLLMSPSMNSISSNMPNGLSSNTADPFDDFLSLPFSSTGEENQVTSTVMIPSDPPPPPRANTGHLDQQSYSQNDPYVRSQTYPEINHSMNNHGDEIPRPSTKSSSKLVKKRNRSNPIKNSSSASSKPTCTRCGHTRLIDITRHEFPKQKGLVFECTSCGNSSIRSNVSADERKRRLAKVAADHLNQMECSFCRIMFHGQEDYITHLRVDHQSNKPM